MGEANPQVVVLGGPNGAGKSTLAPFLLRDTFSLLEFVNADTISAGLSAFNAQAVALNAGRVMLTRLRDLAANKQNFAFESTLATRSYAPWLNRLKRTGYEFHMLFLWLSTPSLRFNECPIGFAAVDILLVKTSYVGAMIVAAKTFLNFILHLPILGPFMIIPGMILQYW